jgi:AraC family transcriptional regulator
MSNELRAGEYYGEISNNKKISSTVLSEVSHKRSVDIPTHSHELAFFSFLLDGSYSETYGGKSFSYRPMTIWWHRPGVLHKDEVGKRGAHFFTIEIQPQYLLRLQEIMKLPEDFYVQNDRLTWSACRLYREFKNWQIGSELIAEGIMLEMLGFSSQRQRLTRTRPPGWLLRVIDRLNDDLAGNFTIEYLAAEEGVHPVHLAVAFRKFQHQTIGEYVRQRRLARATQMLFDREIPLAEIALATGFFDQSHFTRVFKRYLGTTPASFRQTLIGKKK